MTSKHQSLSAELDRVGTGDVSPDEARPIVQAALRATDTDHSPRVYASFRNLTWKLLTARDFGASVSSWYDLIKTASATTRRTKRSDIAERLATLADLLAQAGRFEELQSPNQILQRRHVRKLLSLLADHGGKASRSVISQTLALADANLSRILTALRSNGLVARMMDGKEAWFELTDAGFKAIRAETGAVGKVDVANVPVPLAIYHRKEARVTRNAAFEQLTADYDIDQLLDLPMDAWTDAVAALATDRVPVRGAQWQEFAFQGGRALRCAIARAEDHDVFALIDVSEHRHTIEVLRDRIESLRAENLNLQDRLSHANGRIHSWGSAMREVREVVLSSSAAAWKNVLEHADTTVIGTSHAMPKAALLAQAKAINYTVGSLLLAPDPDKMDMALAVDVRRTIEESLESYRAVLQREVEVTFGSMRNAQANVPLEPAVTWFMHACSRHYDASFPLRLSASVVKQKLILTMKSQRHALKKGGLIHLGEMPEPAIGMKGFEEWYGDLGMDFEVEDDASDHIARLAVPVVIPAGRQRQKSTT